LPGPEDPYGSLLPVDEEGAHRTSGLVIDEQAAHHRGYGVELLRGQCRSITDAI
jgi:hypothetical protein